MSSLPRTRFPEIVLKRLVGSCFATLVMFLASSLSTGAIAEELRATSTVIAYGVDYVPDPRQLARLTLSRPDVIQYLGPANPPGGTDRLFAACDFRGNDFSTLYCLDRENIQVDDATNLVAVDVKTAKLTHLAHFTLGGAGNEGMNGLTYDPTTGKMFAVTCYPFFDENDSLYELDIDALTLTQIGVSSEGLCLQDVAADNDGRLWGLDIKYDGLYSIDKETGEMALVGPFGFRMAYGQGMDFDASDNTCYLFAYNTEQSPDRGELHTCDTQTGQAEFVGVLGGEIPGAGHWGDGAIAAPYDCHVTLDLAEDEVQAGEPLSVRVEIVHNRAETVRVPLTLAIEDESGNVVVSRTGARTMKLADRLDKELMLRIPKTLLPGLYTVSLEVGEMEQGDVRLTKIFTVVPSSN